MLAAYLTVGIHACCCGGTFAGAQSYDQANEREGDIPFEEQLRGLERVVKQGKVCGVAVCSCGCVVCVWVHTLLGVQGDIR